MSNSELDQIVALCDEALAGFRRYDNDGKGEMPTTYLNRIGHAIIEQKEVRPDLKKLISIRDYADLRAAAFNTFQNSFITGASFACFSGYVHEVKSIIVRNIRAREQEKLKNPPIVFYSWQSNLPNSTNRGFIQTCIENAIASISKEGSIVPRMEQGAQGVAGSKSLHAAIIRKIEASTLFIADVSLVGGPESSLANSNVMYELGYATHCLGEDRVLLVCNTAYGKIENLPFDIKHKIVLGYHLVEADKKAEARKSLASRIETQIRSIALGC